MVDPIDEVAIQNLQTYKEKKFVDISKEDLELGLYFFLPTNIFLNTILHMVANWDSNVVITIFSDIRR